MKRVLIAATAASSLLFATIGPAAAWLPPPPPAPIHAGAAVPIFPFAFMGCVGGIILAGAIVSQRDHRELTEGEALLCGLPALFEAPQAPPPHQVVLHSRG